MAKNDYLAITMLNILGCRISTARHVQVGRLLDLAAAALVRHRPGCLDPGCLDKQLTLQGLLAVSVSACPFVFSA